MWIIHIYFAYWKRLDRLQPSQDQSLEVIFNCTFLSFCAGAMQVISNFQLYFWHIFSWHFSSYVSSFLFFFSFSVSLVLIQWILLKVNTHTVPWYLLYHSFPIFRMYTAMRYLYYAMVNVYFQWCPLYLLFHLY